MTPIGDHPCKPLPARTRAAMEKGMPQRKAVATTTKPVSMVRVNRPA